MDIYHIVDILVPKTSHFHCPIHSINVENYEMGTSTDRCEYMSVLKQSQDSGHLWLYSYHHQRHRCRCGESAASPVSGCVSNVASLTMKSADFSSGRTSPNSCLPALKAPHQPVIRTLHDVNGQDARTNSNLVAVQDPAFQRKRRPG